MATHSVLDWKDFHEGGMDAPPTVARRDPTMRSVLRRFLMDCNEGVTSKFTASIEECVLTWSTR